MTLLSMIRDVCAEVGVPRPNAVCAATDPTMRALLSHAQEEGRSLSRQGGWQILRKEKTFVSLAQETQTAMVATDLARFVDKTFYNRSRNRRLVGPATPAQWQRMKATTASPIVDYFTMRGGAILINPAPPAGQTFAYEYFSTQWCASSVGAGQSLWAADTDVGALDESLMKLGVIWRFKAQRGMAFDTDYSKYMFEVKNALGQEAPHDNVDFSGESSMPMRGIAIPESDWAA